MRPTSSGSYTTASGRRRRSSSASVVFPAPNPPLSQIITGTKYRAIPLLYDPGGAARPRPFSGGRGRTYWAAPGELQQGQDLVEQRRDLAEDTGRAAAMQCAGHSAQQLAEQVGSLGLRGDVQVLLGERDGQAEQVEVQRPEHQVEIVARQYSMLA